MRFRIHILAALTVATLLTPSLRAEIGERTVGTSTSPNARKSAVKRHEMTSAIDPKQKRLPYPRTELFLGYSYLRATPTFAAGNRLVDLNGGSASIAFNLTRYFGLVTDFGGFADSQVRLNGPGANPSRQADSNGNVFTGLFGPRFSYRGQERFVPFAQVLAGGIYASSVTLKNCAGSTCTVLPAQTSFALTAGGGLDLKLTRRLALRLVQGEYLMTRLADTTTGISTRQNDIRLSSGLVFRFGGTATPSPIANHPPVAACAVHPDDSSGAARVHVSASDPDGDSLSYRWSATAGQVKGDGADAVWTPGTATPGIYAVSVIVEDGHGGMATCASSVHVTTTANRPPTLTCSIDRISVTAGDPLTMSAVASDPDQDPITFAWETTGGRIVGTGSSAMVDTSGLLAGPISVRVHAFDGRGGVADCVKQVQVLASPSVAISVLEQNLALHSIYFPTAKPTALDPNHGILSSQQATLVKLAEDFKKYLSFRADARLTLEGHADSRGSVEYNMALTERRVNATRNFLIDHGVPESSLQVKAFGKSNDLTNAEVIEAINKNSELTSSERSTMLKKLSTISLASNRRVDVTLQDTGQKSVREYPFNAKDAMALLNEDSTGKHSGNVVKTTRKPAAPR